MSYVECVNAGEQLLATAHKVSGNRQAAVYRLDVTQDKNIIASFAGTVYTTKKFLIRFRLSY